jgi:hypothetical protein
MRYPHTPMRQFRVAPEQRVPHEPQLFGSKFVFVHIEPQRSGARPGHVHAPIVQPANIGHVIPHAPQLFGSVIVFTHVPLHCIVPVGHIETHDPPLQN